MGLEGDDMKRRLIWISLGAAVAIACAAVAWFALSPSTGTADTATAGATLPPDRVTADDKVMGSVSAPVTVIEYYAQACSHCARFDSDVFPLLKAKYIDTGKVRYVMRLYPLFPIDGPSYKLTRCVPPQSYFRAVDFLFRNQPEWDSAEYPGVDAKAGLIKMARILGMSEDQAETCMNSTEGDAAINRIAQEATERYKPAGTPTFVINFRRVDLPQESWAEAQAAIDAALAAGKNR